MNIQLRYRIEKQKMLKGQCDEIGIDVEGLNILICTFCIFSDGLQGLLKAFHCAIQLKHLYLPL
jgi:hypothetical protein